MERINDLYARGNSFQGVVNNVSESKKSIRGDKVDEMKFIKGVDNYNKCNSIKLSPPGNRLTIDELKYSIKEAMQTLSNKSPAVLALLVMMYEAFNKNNQALADINAKMTVINEGLMETVAKEIKSKGRWDLYGSIANTGLSAALSVGSSFLNHKASNLHTDAISMDAASSAIPAKTGVATDPAVTTDAIQNTNSGPGTSDLNMNILTPEPGGTTTENHAVTDSTPSTPTKLTESVNVTEEIPDGSKLHAKAKDYTTAAQLCTTLANIGFLGQVFSQYGKSEEAKQVVDQNYAQVALTLFQTGSTDSDSSKKYVEAMLQAILNIIENTTQARDTAAQNC